MSKELEDHNDGQKAGANATFLDSMITEWNPFLSVAYKRGFRHAEQQSRGIVSDKKKADKRPEDADEVETPWGYYSSDRILRNYFWCTIFPSEMDNSAPLAVGGSRRCCGRHCLGCLPRRKPTASQ